MPMLRRTKRGGSGKAGPAVFASVALHAGLVGGMALLASGADSVRKEVAYRVDIVSPPPNVAGAPPAEEPKEQQAAPPAPAAQPAAPEPTPPTPAPPEPKPEPPKATPPRPRPEPPKEPPKAPAPTRTPARETPRRETPREQPKATPPRETTTNRPSSTTTGGRTTTPPRNTTSGTGNAGDRGTAPNRTTGQGRGTEATGRNPDPNSPGGEGLNIRSEGVTCPEGYCNNVVRQVRRYFRAPEGSRGTANVCFTIARDGTVEDDIRVEGQRGGGAAFRIALVEAVEQAGRRSAFGRLPTGFRAEVLPVCVRMTPEMM